jgi:DNA polymerase-1
MRHNMDILAETYLKYSPQSLKHLLVKKEESKSMRDVTLEEIKEYAPKMPM